MSSTSFRILLALWLGLALPARSEPTDLVTEAMVLAAVQYPGEECQRQLLYYVKSDYHGGLALYYAHPEKGGFMALERFDLALERAIGDIRELKNMKDDAARKEKAVLLFKNWKKAFERAPVAGELNLSKNPKSS